MSSEEPDKLSYQMLMGLLVILSAVSIYLHCKQRSALKEIKTSLNSIITREAERKDRNKQAADDIDKVGMAAKQYWHYELED